jgi:hypothetical protein
MLARCAHCQQTFSTERFGVQTCPHCGSQVLLSDPNAPRPQGPAGPPSAPPPPAAGAPAAEQSAPFARRRELGFVAGYWETLKRVAAEPGAFFRGVRIGETGSAVFFGVVAMTLGSWVSAVYGWAASASWMGMVRQVLERMPRRGQFDPAIIEGFALRASGFGFVAQIVAAPLVSLVAIYVFAAIVHVFLLLFRGVGRGFDATLTAVGYSAGLFLFQVLPICGGLIALVWALVAVIAGIGETQRCGSGKAAMATLAPFALLVCCACGLGILVAAGVSRSG